MRMSRQNDELKRQLYGQSELQSAVEHSRTQEFELRNRMVALERDLSVYQSRCNEANKKIAVYECDIEKLNNSNNALLMHYRALYKVARDCDGDLSNVLDVLERSHHSLQTVLLGTERLTYMNTDASVNDDVINNSLSLSVTQHVPSSTVWDLHLKMLLSEVKKLKKDISECYDNILSRTQVRAKFVNSSKSVVQSHGGDGDDFTHVTISTPGNRIAWSEEHIDKLHTIITKLTAETAKWERRCASLRYMMMMSMSMKL